MKDIKFFVFFICFIFLFNTVVYAEEIETPTIEEEFVQSAENAEDNEESTTNISEDIENKVEEEITEVEKQNEEIENTEEINNEESLDNGNSSTEELPVQEFIEDSENEEIEKTIEEELSLNIDILGKNYDSILPYIEKLQEKGIIVNIEYDYSDFYEEDCVIDVSCEDLSTLVEGDELLITLSLGKINESLLLTSNLSMVQGNMTQSNGDAANKGYMVDWDRIPASYEYNWDNSSNCWNWGVWHGSQCYKTPEGTYSTDVRHKMQIYCDGSYVYLHIIFEREFGVNGYDYQFTINGNTAKVQVNCPSSGSGEQYFQINHGDGSISGQVVEGGECHVFYDNVNNQLELKIPLEEFARQNPNISYSSSNSIEFFTPNLMYNRISCVGASTFPYIPVLLVFGIAIITFYRKKILKNV